MNWFKAYLNMSGASFSLMSVGRNLVAIMKHIPVDSRAFMLLLRHILASSTPISKCLIQRLALLPSVGSVVSSKIEVSISTILSSLSFHPFKLFSLPTLFLTERPFLPRRISTQNRKFFTINAFQYLSNESASKKQNNWLLRQIINLIQQIFNLLQLVNTVQRSNTAQLYK